MVLSPGQTLQKGKYTVEQELRRGLYDISYMTKRSDGDRWLVKILNPQVLAALPNDAERDRLKTQFWQEAVRLAQFSNMRHIVRVEMPFTEGDLLCLPVECVDGRSLGERARNNLTEAEALEYVQQIGEALAAVHQKGIVHRGVQPGNILLRITASGAEAVLTNFSLAVDCDTEFSRTRTREAANGFSPLELYGHGQRVGAYTDVYSLAATLYELLTGDVPPSAEKRKRDNVALVPPQVKNSQVSTEVSNAVVEGMSLLPSERPQSIEAWLALLEKQNQASSEYRDEPSSSEPANHNTPDWGKWQTILAAVAIVATLVGIVLPIWMAREPAAEEPAAEEPATAESAPE